MTAQEFGELIRIRREAGRFNVEELAARFKLSPSTLRSIEAGRLEHLPHAVYARGFVRSYAQAVGVSPEELEEGIAALFPPGLFDDVPTVPGPISAKPAKPGRRAGDKLITLALVLILLVLPIGAGWFVITNYGDDIMDLIKKPLSATPSTSSMSASSATPSTAEEATEPANAASSALPVTSGTGQPASQAEDTVFQAAVPQTQNAEQASAPHIQPQGEEQPAAPQAAAFPVAVQNPVEQDGVTQSQEAPAVDGSYVGIQTRRGEKCWVQITVDGGAPRAFTLLAGESSILPYKRRISVLLGNAGGVDITHNGRPYTIAGKLNEPRTLEFR